MRPRTIKCPTLHIWCWFAPSQLKYFPPRCGANCPCKQVSFSSYVKILCYILHIPQNHPLFRCRRGWLSGRWNESFLRNGNVLSTSSSHCVLINEKFQAFLCMICISFHFLYWATRYHIHGLDRCIVGFTILVFERLIFIMTKMSFRKSIKETDAG